VLVLILYSCNPKKINIVLPDPEARSVFGSDKLAETLAQQGYKCYTYIDSNPTTKGPMIYIETASVSPDTLPSEGYSIQKTGRGIEIKGNDATGTLYGCLELSDRIKEAGKLPRVIKVTDKPSMVLRGAAIGLQKPELLPGRHVYEYPVTPENFPWFYDRDLWTRYLDLLVENRMNSLYIWNGHPFASLVKLEDYPYAVEVDEATFEKNREMFAFITEEADKRGIWVIQMFYNIIVSQPFAEHNNLATQQRSRGIIPVISDYTRKSVAAFIENYPNVGLMVCLGEAMNTIDDDVQWFTETIIPGVMDGLEALGEKDLPPIILRGHDTDAKRVMEAALPIYSNLYTTFKYNGESLTTYNPQAEWIDNNTALSSLGSVHISNVHILANLEPFRYGSPDFIKKSTIAMHRDYKANGLHLYPQASYWDWPYTADAADPRLLQIDRDWIWYAAWGRYAWNCEQDSTEENSYWSRQIGELYGSEKAGHLILEAYEESGEIAPKLLRKFGISDGNRQTLLLGMTMSQLVNPEKYHVYESFVRSSGPPGERLDLFVRKELNGEPHSGETAPMVASQVVEHGQKAKEAIDRAARFVKTNNEEFERLRNDMYCYDAIARFFASKIEAAQLILEYKYTGDISKLQAAIPPAEKSVEYFRELTNLTRDHYLYANSMQTQQRRIPIAGIDGKYKTWQEMLPVYEQELENLKRNVSKLSEGVAGTDTHRKLEPVVVQIKNPKMKEVILERGARIYSDQDFYIEDMDPALEGMKFYLLSYNEQLKGPTSITFNTEKKVHLLTGYFNGNSLRLLPPPALETNATANEYGQADIKIANAMTVNGLFPVNIYTYTFDPGEYTLELGRGLVLLLGFTDGTEAVGPYDAGIGQGDTHAVDWLFY